MPGEVRGGELSPILTAATNRRGGVTGMMVSPPNLTVAAAAVGLAGEEGTLPRRTIPWRLGLAAAVGALAAAPSLGPSPVTRGRKPRGRLTNPVPNRASPTEAVGDATFA